MRVDMKIAKALCVVFFMVMCFQYAWAHHSTANFNFDDKARVIIKGKATYFSFTNPHSFLRVNVEQQDGSVKEYTIFMTARAVLQRYGWRPNIIQFGDIVEIEGSPDFKKPNELYMQRIVFADGEEWRRDSVAE